MFFVGDRTPPKSRSWRLGCARGYLMTRLILAEADGRSDACRGASAQLEVETGAGLDRSISRDDPASEPSPPVALRAQHGVSGPVTLRAEWLIEARSCTRLFQLVRRFGLPSPALAWPTPSESEVRRALVWAGAWGRGVATLAPRVLLGESAALVAKGADGPDVVVVGTIDVLVEWADGSCDVLVIATEPLISARYELYAAVLAHSAASRRPGSPVRIGLIAFTAPPMEDPCWLDVMDADAACAAVRDGAARIVTASPRDLARRVDVETQDRIARAYRGGVPSGLHSARRLASGRDS